jgi:hypothetical protein
MAPRKDSWISNNKSAAAIPTIAVASRSLR